MMDTVGVICRDRNGNVSAGVSSGGILLKRPGRVGEAAMFGCGCYALNLASQSNAAKESAACGVSGCGEHVMKTRLAEKCCSSAFLNSSDGRKGGLYDSLRVTLQDFLDHPWLSHIPQRLCGLVVLHEYVNGEPSFFLWPVSCANALVVRGIEIAWGHTSASFAVGYFREGDCKPTVLYTYLMRCAPFSVLMLIFKALVSRLPKSSQVGNSFLIGGTFTRRDTLKP
jgi:taspase (threonine aspartase 1)